MSGLMPGETVLKDSGRLPVAYAKNSFRTINGRLILTNTRLIFIGGRFQSIIESFLQSHREKLEIPLASITRVEKGFMAHIKVYADKEYSFKGMRDPNGWIAAIEQAKATQQLPHPAPNFCPYCGNPIRVGDVFCPNCGRKIL